MEFGEKLRSERLQRRLSQAELAGDHFSASYISRLEGGDRLPTPEAAEYLAQRLGMNASDLCSLSREDEGQDQVNGSLASVLSWASAAENHPDQKHLQDEIAAARVRAAEGHLPEAWWVASTILLRSLMRTGGYRDAVELAVELVGHLWVKSSPPMLAESLVLASTAARAVGDFVEAARFGRSALEVTCDLPDGDPLRIRAIISVLATQPHDREELGQLLAACVESTSDERAAGLAAWTMGNEAFAAGDAAAGVAWHARAAISVRPDVDFVNWARFCRASADERIKAGVSDGVDELLEQAAWAVKLLGNEDELAELCRTKAAHFVALGRADQAIEVTSEGLELAAISDLTRGDLLLVDARARIELGQFDTGTSNALAAARSFAMAGRADRALQAWQVHDAAQGLVE